MQLGKMNKLISIMKTTTSKGTTGQHIETFTKFKEAWAFQYFENGNEVFESNKETAVNKCKFFIRFTSDITEQMKIYYKDDKYDITSIEYDNKNIYLIIRATKKV